MAVSLHDLPLELVESVLQDLDFNDKKALRLVSTRITDIIDKSSFREHYRKKNVYTTMESLQAFARLTKESHLARLLQDLSLIGIATFKGEHSITLEEVQLRASLLREALNNIRLFSQSTGLASLSLEAVARIGEKVVSTDEALRGSFTEPCKPRPSRNVWTCTAQTFQIAVLGLVGCRVTVRELHLFTNVDRCALGCDGFSIVLGEDLSTAFGSVKALSMSISSRFPPPRGGSALQQRTPLEMEEANAESTSKGKVTLYDSSDIAAGMPSGQTKVAEHGWAFKAWLRNFTALETLEVQWFEISRNDFFPCLGSAEAFFDHLGGSVRNSGHDAIFAGLRTLVLKNIKATAPSLLRFVERHEQLQEAILHHIHLESSVGFGAFEKWMTSEKMHLQSLEIHRLWVGDAHMPRVPGYMRMGVPWGDRAHQQSATIRHDGTETSAEEWVNIDDKRRKYGPPWRLD